MYTICFYCNKEFKTGDIVLTAAEGGSEIDPPFKVLGHKKCIIKRKVVVPSLVIGLFFIPIAAIIGLAEKNVLYFLLFVFASVVIGALWAIVAYDTSVKNTDEITIK